MKIDRNRLYESALYFFEAKDRSIMKLSPTAALSVCNEATARGLVVARVEGGMWHSPGFEARLDCIWDGTDPPIEIEEANTNNRRAADFVRNESDVHSVFVITAPPIAGWPHKSI